ncbi:MULTISPECIES: phage head closure protein [Roseobacteraceae]|uniref:Phage head-tail joining protein n=1 Tax=Pseudosulfitobacter pseudonitzschiae TaxID=1402135 RepID=A0A221JYT9_9RHOB|nr:MULTISPECIES: phage head closure protein [Roseobacteraceae]ASM71915.1 phage head-tail joining protein [Pseudosulfitobacter pseudonitzschiae]
MKMPRLSRKLSLETPVRIADGAGGYAQNWEVLGVLWAQVLPRTGRETASGPAAVSHVSFRIIVRGAPEGYPERPTAKQRFRDGNRVFRITAVAEHDAEGRYLTCFANEEVAT